LFEDPVSSMEMHEIFGVLLLLDFSNVAVVAIGGCLSKNLNVDE